MIVQSLAFYLTSIILVASAALVITVRNPVHAVLFLILAFFQAAGLFVLVGAEFLAMLLVVVYVGAVAVLFLFVVMMLDIKVKELQNAVMNYLPVGGTVAFVMMSEVLAVVSGWVPTSAVEGLQPIPPLAEATNTEALGRVLYTDYLYLFQGSGIVLLIAMIGAIVLTLRERAGVRRQHIPTQLARTRAETVEVRKVPTGRGI